MTEQAAPTTQKTLFSKKESETKKTLHFLLEKRKWSKENQSEKGKPVL